MRIFDLPPLMERIMQDVDAEREIDAGALEALLTDGPKAIDAFCLAIAGIETASEALTKRIGELRVARNRNVSRAASLRDKLQSVIETSFNGDVETAEHTCWVQGGTLRIRPVGRKKE